MTQSNYKVTPEMGIFYLDRAGQPRSKSWNHHFIIGMLNYLAKKYKARHKLCCSSMHLAV
jgi:hypothetical protein